MEKFQEPAVCAALKEYKSVVSKHNLAATKTFINYAEGRTPKSRYEEGSESYDEDAEGEDLSPDGLDVARLEWCMKILLDDSHIPEGFSKPQDIIDKWDSFASEYGLDGGRVSGGPDERAARWDEIVRGLRDGLQEIGDDAAELDIAGDFAILLNHVDTLEGHQWGKAKNQQCGLAWFQGFSGYSEAKASVRDPETLKGHSAFAWGSDKPHLDPFEHVVAGFETGQVPEGGGFMIYGRLTGDQESKWYYYLNMGQFGIEVYDSLVDFLQWYQHANIASEHHVENSCYGLWDDQSMFF